MKISKYIKSILIFLLGALCVLGYQKVNRFLQIDKCLDQGGRWNYELNSCELNEMHILDESKAYKLQIKNENVTKFIQSYISEVENQIPSSYVLVLNIDQINDGRKYTINISTHEIYSNMGSYNYEDEIKDDLEPQILYASIGSQIILIKSGIEKLNSNLNRYEFLLDLTSDRIDASFKTRSPDHEGFYELNAPPTQHFDYWEMYECDNKYEILKRNAWGEILNDKITPKNTFCNHIGDNENPPEPLKPPNE